MKTNKLIAAGALALSMAMTPVASLINAMPIAAETVTVSSDFVGTHSFTAYQIFKGTQGDNGILGNITWGDGVDSDNFLNKLKTESAKADSSLSGFATLFGTEESPKTPTASDVATVLATTSNNSTEALAFAKLVNGYTKGSGTAISAETTSLPAGYYLIKDISTQDKEVVGLSILQLTGTTDGIQIKPKNGKPTVDKEVKDEGNQGDGWGETADHDLNKQIDFKLTTGTSLTKANIDNYDTYYLEFQDTLSAGLTFDSITSVKMGETSLTENTDYTVTRPTDQSNVLKITFSNLKNVTGYATATDINVTVEYKAHLNENAVLNTTTGSIDNNNVVQLIYSNNPNGTGTGTSEPDKVYVASFKLTNTKKALSENGAVLSGAGFELWKGDQVAVFKDVEKDGKTISVFQKWVSESDALADGEKKMIVSGTDGDFSMYGLDAGTYTLKEVQTPAGYNTAADTTITVSATHEEATDGDSATVKLETGSSTSTTVVNKQTGALPETGGMGTTMIYGVGAVMVTGAAVFYVTNKRTRKD